MMANDSICLFLGFVYTELDLWTNLQLGGAPVLTTVSVATSWTTRGKGSQLILDKRPLNTIITRLKVGIDKQRTRLFSHRKQATTPNKHYFKDVIGCLCTSTPNLPAYIQILISLYLSLSIYIYLYVPHSFLYLSMSIYIYLYLSIYISIYIYLYPHIYLNLSIWIFTYLYWFWFNVYLYL